MSEERSAFAKRLKEAEHFEAGDLENMLIVVVMHLVGEEWEFCCAPIMSALDFINHFYVEGTSDG